MEKILLIFTIFMTAAAIGLLVGLIVVANQNSDDHENSESDLDSICLTETCIQEAAMVLQRMNQEVDP